MQQKLILIKHAMHDAGLPWAATALAFALMALNLGTMAMLGMAPRLDQFLLVLALSLALLGGCAVYAHWRCAPVLAGIFAALAVHLTAGSFGGVQAMLGVAAGFPLVDSTLARIDHSFGISHPDMLVWLAGWPDQAVWLGYIYSTTVPLITLVAFFLAMRSDFDRLRIYLSTFVLMLTMTVLIATVTPAIGTYVHYHIEPSVLARLPTGSGIYHLSDFHRLRAGEVASLGPFELNGVITFPSFHAAMALLITFGLGGSRFSAAIGWCICIPTLIATVLVGGHFVIDLVGGSLIFAVALMASRKWYGPGQVRRGARFPLADPAAA